VKELVLHDGDRVLITGANGSGKSTLLKLVAGVIPPDRGRIHRARGLARSRLGYVPQAGGLYPDLTVAKNVALRQGVCGVPMTLESQALADLGLVDLLEKRAGALSGGFQRLAAVAAALAIDPHWLALDEPFSGLDAQKRSVLGDVLGMMATAARIVLVTSPTSEHIPFATRRLDLVEGSLA
jgi:ABC-type multidrug transport system ATPase subunit